MARIDDLPLWLRATLRGYPWRRVEPVPRAPLVRPLHACTVALVTTAGLLPQGGRPGPGGDRAKGHRDGIGDDAARDHRGSAAAAGALGALAARLPARRTRRCAAATSSAAAAPRPPGPRRRAAHRVFLGDVPSERAAARLEKRETAKA